ncbi:family 16 glycosylhydrolase [Actinoplanes auranticolor]|uniref:Glycosyl hydrolase family 16 n=1 Tax=Actinoplanes auranticolor TaxID=47988 RepID=A0A919VKB2_9ACTN|nr:family 16 glycosylhydrolase [Actinoplanes auranticolor]GIM66050.1 hypothetical protein Aau02nite_21440 [Actinoplanes auranticolor]
MAAAAVVLGMGLSLAGPAASAAPPSAVQRMADGLESSIEDRVRAAAVVGVVAPDSWLVLNERDFVFALWQHAGEATEVRASAELALMNSSSTRFDECTVYIESGIHAAKDRDVADEVRDAGAARQAREVKQRALVSLEIRVTPELLLLADREFIYAVYLQATGALVRAGALTAFGGTAQQQRDFISTGIVAAREQDRLDEIAADQERTEAERQALREREARKRAAALFLIAADEGLLAASDEGFVRWAWTRATPNTQVYLAATATLRSSDPAVWSAFIHTGLADAFRRDTAEALRQIGLQQRAQLTTIMNDATASGRGNLARAAQQALNGSDQDVQDFLTSGIHRVSDNECAKPEPAAGDKSWGANGPGVTGARQAITDHPSATAEYSVSHSTAVTAGMFLPQQKVLAGAVWEFSAEARTSAPARVRMEVDWYSATSGYLGRTNGGFLPVPGTRAFTKVSGQFTAPATAVRANVLTKATDLPAGGSFASTACAYRPIVKPDVTLSAAPGNGTVSITWRTDRKDITGWNVGRDGTDSRDNGPWSTERPADTRTHQFNLLKNESYYSFTVIPRTATGTLSPVTISARPSATAPAGDGDQAAVRHNWGTARADFSDEFEYVGAPDATKWSQSKPSCDPTPHHADALRCPEKTTVDNGRLIMTGSADAKSGWVGNKWKTTHGRWEARVRSKNTASSNGKQHHPLLLIFPSDNSWPINGEYDFLENMAPGEQCAQAFLHYPHDEDVDVQQVRKVQTDCGAPLSEWHNFAFEWTPDHIRGFIDGKEWYTLSGGGNSIRRDIETMNNGRLTIQLDNFDGKGITPAMFEVAWVRVYDV